MSESIDQSSELKAGQTQLEVPENLLSPYNETDEQDAIIDIGSEEWIERVGPKVDRWILNLPDNQKALGLETIIENINQSSMNEGEYTMAVTDLLKYLLKHRL